MLSQPKQGNYFMLPNRSVGQARKRIGSEATDEYEIIIGPPKTLSSKRKIPLNEIGRASCRERVSACV